MWARSREQRTGNGERIQSSCLRTAITADVLYSPWERLAEPIVLIEDGRIVELTSRAASGIPGGVQLEAFPGAVLAPGFIDIHTHGAAGHDVMEATPEALAAMEHLMAAHGVTAYCPTTVTASVETTLVALERLADRIESQDHDRAARARALGIHLEGPFISQAKRGVHPPEHIQPPSLELFDRFFDAARGHVSLMTVAPELPGACELMAEAARRGVRVSLGHSAAGYETTQAAIAAGARHATHTFNAMRALDHRSPGVLGAVLGDDRLTADIIADGVHVHPAVVQLFLRSKGHDKAVLITDSISATGMPEGHYRLGSFQVEVAGGKCLREGHLAGSVLTLDRALRNVMSFAGLNLPTALHLVTANPARVLGLADRGRLAPGNPADIVVLSPAGEVIKTFVGGGA